jgi:hypothetical protein
MSKNIKIRSKREWMKHNMQYSKKRLEELGKIAKKHGTFESVSDHLKISISQLYADRKKNTELDTVLKKAIKSYKIKYQDFDKYAFSDQELEQITKLVTEENIEAAARTYGVSAHVFHSARTNNSGLNAAIIKGQEQRKANTFLNQALSMFKKLDYKEALEKITEIALDGGVNAVEKYYKVSPHILRKCREELPKLDAAIKDALKQKPAGAAIPSVKAKIIKTKKDKKARKTKTDNTPKIKAIINTTLSGISDQTEVNLANFKKMIERNKQLEYAKRLKNGDFDNMI